MRLMRFPGEPEKGGRIQSELWAVLADIDGVEYASSDGDVVITAGLTFWGVGTAAVGLMSGDRAYGEDASEDESLNADPFLWESPVSPCTKKAARTKRSRGNRREGGCQDQTYGALFAATCFATAAETPPSFECLPLFEPSEAMSATDPPRLGHLWCLGRATHWAFG